MKADELFNPTSKSLNPPAGLVFRLVRRADREAISILMSQRNPDQELSEIYKKTDRELDTVESDQNYRLYVAELNKKVVGFCRYYHSSGLPVAKKIYAAPEGWYGMGIMVDPNMRRQGIARFLSLSRIQVLKNQGITEFYSVVDAKNFTSERMHREFGFEEVSRGEGFLNIKFESGTGYLFRLQML